MTRHTREETEKVGSRRGFIFGLRGEGGAGRSAAGGPEPISGSEMASSANGVCTRAIDIFGLAMI